MTLPFENNLINNRYGLSDQSMNNEWSWTKPLGLAIVVSLHIGEVRGQSQLLYTEARDAAIMSHFLI